MPNGEIVEMVGGPIVLPEPGKSYQVTLRLIPPLSGGITVLTTTIEQVSAWRCPPPFRSRPGHAYLIRCQVTFLPGVVGMARLSRRAPNPEWDSTGVRISAQ